MSTLIADLHQALVRLPPDERLKALHALPATIDTAMHSTVAELRAQGYTWAQIGNLIGVTRQTAQQRFGNIRTTATGTQTVIAELVEIYNAGRAAQDIIGDKPVTMFDTDLRIAAQQKLNAAQRRFADHLEAYATQAAITATGNNPPTPPAIKNQKQHIFNEFQATIR
jgi:hypothetical protein